MADYGVESGAAQEAERGNTTHGPRLDDKMKQETQGAMKGNKPAHVEEWRETEPFPDDTDRDDADEGATGDDRGGDER
ncbi:hypothetical protein BIU82_06335 [Arthrobacter sp. SW1]|uniref:hypothetical protein n=1 Tax=Arthrobacter sp. SW1 TaxID=1920889 RepID=UPI000877E4A7|nr:hypothetical protein [Arthrobacter sp. SW1]OFI38112.1 hypothetical protein BIU82_06335 [Arthrobacter sp. SW1]